jgi:hypothetical protein
MSIGHIHVIVIIILATYMYKTTSYEIIIMIILKHDIVLREYFFKRIL